jgi:hypothetical protein
MSKYDDERAEYLAWLAEQNKATSPAKEEDRGFIGAVKDAGLTIAGGGAHAVKSLLSPFRSEDAVSGDAYKYVGKEPTAIDKVYDYFAESGEISQSLKTSQLQGKQGIISRKLHDPESGLTDAALYAIQNPSLLVDIVLGSVPSIALGGAAGGAAIKVAAALKGAAVGTVGSLALTGAGEGSVMALDVFDKTRDGAAALQALALGTITGGIPGNVTANIGRRLAGEAAETGTELGIAALGRAGAAGIAARTGVAVGAETGQEIIHWKLVNRSSSRTLATSLSAGAKQASKVCLVVWPARRWAWPCTLSQGTGQKRLSWPMLRQPLPRYRTTPSFRLKWPC